MARMKQIGIDVDVNRAIEQARLAFAESENDILRRLLMGEAKRVPAPAIKQAHRSSEDQVRARGLWSVELNGERFPAPNMKEAYRTLLLKLDEQSPQFIDQLASERSRSRRFVARKPSHRTIYRRISPASTASCLRMVAFRHEPIDRTGGDESENSGASRWPHLRPRGQVAGKPARDLKPANWHLP